METRPVTINNGRKTKTFLSVAAACEFLRVGSDRFYRNPTGIIKGWSFEFSDKVEVKKTDFKRLFFDIETSPNIVSSWRVGRKLFIPFENIVKERAIICICYKHEGEKEVHSIKWDGGDDRKMLIKFAEIFNSCDEVVGQNSDYFDIKWLRTRCLYHRIPVNPRIVSLDTLQIAVRKFNFNSNKLDYMAQYLGVGKKIETEYGLWVSVMGLDVLYGGKQKMKPAVALNKMVEYCKHDVIILEKVFNELFKYTEHRTHRAVFEGGGKMDCPECGSEKSKVNKTFTTKMGVIRRQLLCNDCGKYWVVSNKTYIDSLHKKKRVNE